MRLRPKRANGATRVDNPVFWVPDGSMAPKLDEPLSVQDARQFDAGAAPRRREPKQCGRAVGDRHHRTRVPDAVVAEIRDAHENRGETYEAIQATLARRGITVSCSQLQKICLYVRRVGDLVHEQE